MSQITSTETQPLSPDPVQTPPCRRETISIATGTGRPTPWAVEFIKHIREQPDLYEAFGKTLLMHIEEEASDDEVPAFNDAMDRVVCLLNQYSIPIPHHPEPTNAWTHGLVQAVHFGVLDQGV